MSFNRRDFLKGIGLVGVSASIPTKAEVIEKVTFDGAFNFACDPYLQNLQEHQVTICAIFNKPCLAWVEVLDDQNKVVQTVYQTEDGMRNCNTDYFKIKIPRTGNAVNYRVVGKEITRFEPYKIEYGITVKSKDINANFLAKDSDSINCLILNDVHENKESYNLLYNKSKLPTKDLIFLNGDSLHYVSNQKDITDKIIKPIASAFASTTPTVVMRGNHETRGSFARSFKNYFDYPENKFYQAFKMGPVYWIVLDSGEDKPDDHEVYGGTVDYDNYRLEQREWLKKALKAKERRGAKHTIVVTHIPFHHSDKWHGTKHNYQAFHDVLQAAKVDAVISGHTHKHGFHQPGSDHNYCVIIGGGPKVGSRTYIEVSAKGKDLEINLIKETGENLGTFRKKA